MDNIYLLYLPVLFLSAKAQYSLSASDPFATRDREFMLTCSIGSTETSAVMVWSRNGVSVVNIRISDCYEGDPGLQLYNLYEYNCSTSNRRYNLIIPSTRINSEANSQWKCESTAGGSSSNIYTLQFYNKPTTDPVLSGYDGSVLYQGETLTLTCQVSGGSPLATLSWTCGGQQQVSRVSTSGTIVTSVLTLTLVSNHNGKTCICHGRHTDPSYTPDIRSGTLIVYYPPSAPGLFPSQSTPFPWIAAGQGTLNCVSQPGNPPTITYQWIRENVEISGQTGASLTLTSLTKNDNGQSYKCKVSNDYTVYKNVNLVSQPRLLDVEYRPVIDIGTSPAYVIEAGTFERTCTADGNPIPSITWTPNLNPLNGATLRLTNVMRNQTGDYTCKVEARSSAHGLLSNQAVLNVIVQYPPSVSAVLSLPSITEGQDVMMVCLAQGVPDQYTYNGWTQIYRNIVIRSSNDFSKISQNKRNLTLSGVSYQDIGTYRCSANNGIPDKDGNTNQDGVKDLDIKFSAVFNSSTKFYAELNRTVELKIPFLSNPFMAKANISLTKNNIEQKGSDITVTVGSRNLDINFYGKVINVNGQEVIVTLHHFSSKQQGKYTIGVKNYQGGPLSTFVFEVIPSGPPENPKYFGILSKTSNSITVTWLKGFNGGHLQTFVVLYRQKDLNSQTLSSQEIMEEDNRDNYTLRIIDLSPLTTYDFWIYSYNTYGNSTRDIKRVRPLAMQTDEVEQLESSKTYASGIAIGIVIGFIAGVLIESIVISFLLWRKGFWNECKCISGNKPDKNENQQKTQYEDIHSGIEDTNVYDGINSEGINIATENNNRNDGAQNSPESSREGEYEHLDQRPESTVYQQLQNKGAENIQMGSFYVNTNIN